MAKLYEGAIKLASAIWQTGPQPLDDRVVVKDLTALTAPETFADVAYPGMIVVVSETNSAYILKAVTNDDGSLGPADTTKDESWVQLAQGSSAEEVKNDLATLRSEFDALNNTVTGETEGLVAKVDKINGTAETEGSIAYAVAAEAKIARAAEQANADAIQKETEDRGTAITGLETKLKGDAATYTDLGKAEDAIETNASSITGINDKIGSGFSNASGQTVAEKVAAAQSAADAAKAAADERVKSVKATLNSGIVTGGTTYEPTIGLQLDSTGNVLLGTGENGLKASVTLATGEADGSVKIGTSEAVLKGWGTVAKSTQVANDIKTAKEAVLGGTAEEVTDTVKTVKAAIEAEVSRADAAEKKNAQAITDLTNGQVATNTEAIAEIKKQQGVDTAAIATNTAAIEKLNGDGTDGSVKKTVKDAIDALSTEGGAIKKVADDLANETTARTEADAKHTQDIATINTALSSIGTTGSAIIKNTQDIATVSGKVDVDKVSTAISEAVTVEKERAEAAELVHTNAIAGHETRIAANESAIEALSSATHFIGVYTRVGEEELPTDKIFTDKYPKEEGHVPADGDVVLDGNKEYIFSAKAWKELGDTTAEGNRIAEIEKIVNKEGKGSLQVKVTELENNITSGATKQAIDEVAQNLTSEIERAKKAEAMAKTVVSGSTNITVSASEVVDGQPITYTVAADGLALASDLNASNEKITALETFNTTNFEGGKAKTAAKADDTDLAYGKDEKTLTADILKGKAATAGTADTAKALEAEYRKAILTDAASAAKTAGDLAYAKIAVEGYFDEKGVAKTAAVANSVEGTARQAIIDEARTGYETADTAAGKYANKEVEKYFGDGISSGNTVVSAIATAKSGAIADAKAETESQITALNLGTASTHAHEDYATKAQGDKADTALQEITSANKYITINTKSQVQANVASAQDIIEGTINKLVDAAQAKEALAKKVDVVSGSRLMTDAEGTKLEGIAEGAQVNKIEKVTINTISAEPSGDTKNVDITINASHINVGKNLDYSAPDAGDVKDAKIDVVLQDIYTKLKAVDGAKVASVAAKNANELDVATSNGAVTIDVKTETKEQAEKAGHNIILQSSTNGFYAEMYYDGDDAEEAKQS